MYHWLHQVITLKRQILVLQALLYLYVYMESSPINEKENLCYWK